MMRTCATCTGARRSDSSKHFARLVVLLIALFAGGVSVMSAPQYPNCNWNCTANDVTVIEAFVDAPDTCIPGQALSATIYALFDNGTNTNRYAVRVIGDVYIDGLYDQTFDVCVEDTMPPGMSTLPLIPVSWTCGQIVEARIVTVSWASSPETCGDTPKCAARGAKCWFTESIVIGGTPLAVDFSSSSPECDGTPISFTDQTSGGDTPYTYSWDFGDGGTSSSANPSHLYAAPGTYTVTSTITENGGVTNSASYTVDVNPNPVATATTGGPYCPGDTIELFASGGTSYSWSGPNGFSSSLQNPTIPSASSLHAGTYTVTVTDASGCSDQASTIIELDTTPPVLTTPSDVTVECGDSTDPAQTGQATATDSEDPTPTVTYSDLVDLSGCGNTGTITRTWTATDDCGNSVSEPQTITIIDTASPVLTISSAQFECDGSGNASDIASWLASAVATDACGAVSVTNDYTGLTGPCPDVGSASVTFTATDACGNVSTRTATLTVVDNAAPSAADDDATIDEDTSILLAVLANDSDVCDDTPALVSVGTPMFGTATVVGDQVNYIPSADFHGTDTFSYTIEDCSGNTDAALVEVTVLPVNDPPVANDQAATAEEDTPLPITVTASDPDGDVLTYSILTGPSNGTISGFDPATGGLVYTPDENYHGPDSFTFKACDPSGACDTGVVTITVEPVDDPPVADPQDLTTPEDTPLPITVTGSDVDGDPVTYGIVSGPSNGTISGFDPATGDLIYTPDEHFTGTDSFVFETCDPNPAHGCAQATVTITVTPVNDPPVALDQSRTTSEDTETGFFSLLVSDPDNTLAEIVCDCQVPPSHGTVVRGPDHTVNYIPDPNFTGQDTFRYEVCDPSGVCDTATVTVDVLPVADPPVAEDDAVEVAEDGSVEINVPANDSDPDGDLDLGSVSIVSQPGNGTVTVDPITGVVTYEPDEDFNGTDTFTYEICDTEGACDTATVTVEVNPVDDPPVAGDDTTTVPEDGSIAINVPGNDTDPDGDLDITSVSIVSQPPNGTVSVDPITGEITYEPDENFNGQDTFTYEICDSQGLCDTATVTVNVTPVDDPPVANDDSTSTAEDTPIVIGVVGNDFDVDGNLDPTTVTIVSQPANGTVGVDPVTGAVTYTPEADFNGLDTFSYQVCDTDGLCDVADVTVNVGPEDDPPVALDDTAQVLEDGLTTIDVVNNDSDPDGNLDPTSVVVTSPPAHGTFSVDPVTGEIDYEPNENYNGPDTLTYEICDTNGACDLAVVSINVLPVDDPPVALDDTSSVAEDSSVTINVVDNDSDPDGDLDITSVSVLTDPAHGTVTVDPVTGAITYEPDPNFNGQDTFTYQVCDSQGVCDTATVTVNVAPADDLPVATPQDLTTPEDTALAIGLIGSDADGDTLTYNILSGPSHGVISGFDPATGELIYTPNEDYNGPDSFVFEVCDPHPNECGTATVTISVLPIDDPPVAGDDTTQVSEDGSVVIDVPGNDSDPDGNLDLTSVDIVTGPSNGTVTVDPITGEITYEPDENFEGTDTFTYQICDTDGACDTATVTVTVNPVADPPVALNDAAVTPEDIPVEIPVTANDTDADSQIDPTTVVILTQPAHGTMSVDPDTGTVTYQPAPNFNGPDTFVYQVCNIEGACDVARVDIVVSPLNDPPVAACLETAVVAGTTIRIELQGSDPDGDIVTYRILEGPEHGSIVGFDEQDGSFVYVPQPCQAEAVGILVSDSPQAGFFHTRPSEALTISVTGGDPALTTIAVSPENGSVDVNQLAGSIIYTPDEGFEGTDELVYVGCAADEAGYIGPDTVVYEVTDSSGATDQCVVQLFVLAAGAGGGECEHRVVISEVAWSGTDASPDHEWIELRNLEDEPVDLEGWTLRWRRKLPETDEERLWKAIALTGEIDPHAPDAGLEFRPDEDRPGTWWIFWQPAWRDDFVLLERETDDAVLNVDADLIYDEQLPLDRVADLDDRGDVIELVDPTGCVVDTANADHPERDGWIAGTLSPAATMERTDPLEVDVDENWHTNLGLVRTEMDTWGQLIHGTPKHENSPILAEAVAAAGIEPSPAPMGEPILLRFDPLPEWPSDERLWRIVVTRPPHDEVLEAEWTVGGSDAGDILVEIATNRLPLDEELHVWVRTPSGDLLFAPFLLYPY
jgi:hypothetical protein